MSDDTSDRHRPAAPLDELLAELRPVRHAGVYRFATLPETAQATLAGVVCWMREPEGLSIIAAEPDMPEQATVGDYRAGWITLGVHSALAGVGLTAAIAATLAEAGISCNIVAGTRHDHLFVPLERTQDAMALLETMQRQAKARRAASPPAEGQSS